MPVTLEQGLALTLMAIICGIDFWLEGFYIFRPIIVSSVTGLILGDPTTGIICGGITELAFAGLTPAGGTQPPNPVLAGVMSVVIAHTTGTEPAAAMSLSLPFSFLMQYVILLCYSAFSFFMGPTDAAAKSGDTAGVVRVNVICTAIVALLYGIVVFLCAYVAQDAMKTLVENLPEWLAHGFAVTGGVLPAIGFAMLLNVMFTVEFLPFLLIGFVMASFLNFSNLLPVAIVGLALALFVYTIDDSHDKAIKAALATARQSFGGEDEEDGI
ncbi:MULTISPECIES: PTS galactosamine transporter subunit IIC [Atopobiaceae]|mgnify:CR=1 FL=1|uniref:PTS system, galactosamine-specific IIC component n=1 Tax=Parafannyhessea umbonata TaxID=604330 RepID=A0A1H9N9N3_9ACTN|nr:MULTISPECIES: PTS galactosamine transporter subunit IIC [Atopobiaceae]SEH39219.1 PTS system, galactosamine-specific IIC component [Parafannyhessea umbonata]SER32521.1 PTS system, galactosamine-specific IIC component [Parafannyhessea umbonata]SJZ42815.1 PTS system, galactosamine-specific IIC component [Olsenella sp. KH1P3]